MSTSTRTATKTTVTASTSEQLQGEVEAEKVEYPEGAPVLLPVLSLPRSRRAEYHDAMSRVVIAQKKTQGPDGAAPDPKNEDRPMELRLADVAGMTRTLAAIEDVLVVVAEDPDACRAWALSVEDNVLAETFNVYVKKTQPGEASSSAS